MPATTPATTAAARPRRSGSAWPTQATTPAASIETSMGRELASGTVTALTDTSADESPSFAPNSKLIVYATQLQGREALMTTTLDGKIKARLAGKAGDIREPDWGPFQKQ